MEARPPEESGSQNQNELLPQASWLQARILLPIRGFFARFRTDPFDSVSEPLSRDTKLIAASILAVAFALVFVGRALHRQSDRIAHWSSQQAHIEKKRLIELQKKLEAPVAPLPPQRVTPRAPSYVPQQAFVNEQRFFREKRPAESRLRPRAGEFRERREFGKYQSRKALKTKLARKKARMKRLHAEEREHKLVKHRKKSKRGMSAKLLELEEDR